MITAEKVFSNLWAMGYRLTDPKDFEEFKKAMEVLAGLFPEEHWD